ncbi:WD40 repeat-like protein [Amanita rubescens]|nr:WD40 repeat-like protein [Amanita rubescens]
MRARHSLHSLPAVPVYSAAFLAKDLLAVGGGGGVSKSGINNKLRLYTVNDERSIALLDEFQLQSGEDAPMSMAADTESKKIFCGINSSTEKMKMGENQNCRALVVKDNKLVLVKTQGTLSANDSEDYQKVTILSPDRTALAVAGSHTLSVLSPTTLTPIAERIQTDKEIYDATFSKSTFLVLTTHNLLVYAMTFKKRGKGISLVLKKTIDVPDVIKVTAECTFRAARFHPTEKYLFTVLNGVSTRSKKSKNTSRQSFICRWDTETWTVDKHRKVGDRGVTCFDISPDGRFLAFGSSDLSIGILDTSTLIPIVTILKAHEFPPTTIKFNPTSTLLVTGSADNSIRIVNVPQYPGSPAWGIIILILLAIVVALSAIALGKYLS